MGHEEPHQRLLPPAVSQAAPVSLCHPDKAQWILRQGRPVLGGRNRVLRRWREKGHGHGQPEDIRRDGGLHHHPAGQGVLQPSDGGVWEPYVHLERKRENPGRDLCRGGSRGKHHLCPRGGLGEQIQRGGRSDHCRGRDPREQQPDHCDPGYRRGQSSVL